MCVKHQGTVDLRTYAEICMRNFQIDAQYDGVFDSTRYNKKVTFLGSLFSRCVFEHEGEVRPQKICRILSRRAT